MEKYQHTENISCFYGKDYNTKDGTCIRDYIHVMDLAEGHIKTLEFLFENKPNIINMNLGTGKGSSVLELINTFQNVNNVEIPYQIADRREGDLDICFCDPDYTNEILKLDNETINL